MEMYEDKDRGAVSSDGGGRKTEAGWGPEARGTGGAGRGNAADVSWRGLRSGAAAGGAGDAPSTSARQLAGHQRRLPLGEVLGGGDVVSRDLGLLRCSRGQLLLDLGFGHVVVSRVKILLLERRRE